MLFTVYYLLLNIGYCLFKDDLSLEEAVANKL